MASVDGQIGIGRKRRPCPNGCFWFGHQTSQKERTLLIAVGVLPSGNRTVLGVSVSLSEAEVHWREFMNSLCERKLHGVELIVSDDHAGLKQARKACFPGVLWQRCQFHLQ